MVKIATALLKVNGVQKAPDPSFMFVSWLDHEKRRFENYVKNINRIFLMYIHYTATVSNGQLLSRFPVPSSASRSFSPRFHLVFTSPSLTSQLFPTASPNQGRRGPKSPVVEVKAAR